MDELISRQAAIDALKRLQKDISGDYTELDPMVMAGCGYIGDCIGELECLPSAQPEPQWIPCSERLPEDEYVLISKKPTKLSDSKWCMTIAIRMADPRSRKVDWRDIGFNVIQDNEVLAWMPLPELYAERREE